MKKHVKDPLADLDHSTLNLLKVYNDYLLCSNKIIFNILKPHAPGLLTSSLTKNREVPYLDGIIRGACDERSFG